MAEYACWAVTIYRPPVFIAALLSELYCKVWCNLALLFWARLEDHISWQKTNFLKDKICVSYVLKQQNIGGAEWLNANRELVFFLAEENVKWKQLGKWPLQATC